MSHVDPEILALLAFDESAGSRQDSEHLAHCDQCSSELERLTEVAVMAVAIGLDSEFRLESPPAGLWDRIALELDLDPAAAPQPSPPDGQSQGSRARTRRPGARWPGLIRRPAMLALAGALLGAAAAVAVEQVTVRPPVTVVVARAELRPLPQFPQWRSASGTAVLERGKDGQTLAVTLRAQSRPGFFEVWLLGRNGVSMISLGELNARHAGQFILPPDVDLTFYSRVDISLQAFDGSTLHSKVSVVRGSLAAG